MWHVCTGRVRDCVQSSVLWWCRVDDAGLQARPQGQRQVLSRQPAEPAGGKLGSEVDGEPVPTPAVAPDSGPTCLPP